MLLTLENNTIVNTQLDPASKTRFLEDVLRGLGSYPKKLDAKYFYDHTGDLLFQKIMASREYYVTRCEEEIFKTHSQKIADALKFESEEFDVIELGAGDASKTIHLLQKLLQMDCRFCYKPVDISSSIIHYLERELPRKLPGLEVQGLNGEYIEMLAQTGCNSGRRKAVLFLGSNIGNMDTDEAFDFLGKVRECLDIGDKLLLGFDLKKDPATVLAAYNDEEGYTKSFNLNLLERINRELNGKFDIDSFYHYPIYDPASGACKSYLVSKKQQQVGVANEIFSFEEGETIYMELSQKYDLFQMADMAAATSFRPLTLFSDSREWFTDAILECV